MSAEAKALWLVAAIIASVLAICLSGCAHRATLPIPHIRIQETTNNLPPVWPSDSYRGDAETRR